MTIHTTSGQNSGWLDLHHSASDSIIPVNMEHVDKIYSNLVKDVLKNGIEKTDRTGTGTISIFGRQVRYDLSLGFPVLTTKKIHWKSIVGELLWFLKGDTNIKWLNENGISIWNEWADKTGDLGPIYGKQWRNWETPNTKHSVYSDISKQYFHPKNSIDQIKDIISQIKINPDSRRLIVSAWNVGEISQMALAPCHTMFQFYVLNNKLSCQLYQRSCDLGLGQPFNVASYALLTHLIAQVCDLEVGEFIHTFGDLHIYKNHKEKLAEQIKLIPYSMPKLLLNQSIKNIDFFNLEDIKLENYTHHPPISLKVAI